LDVYGEIAAILAMESSVEGGTHRPKLGSRLELVAVVFVLDTKTLGNQILNELPYQVVAIESRKFFHSRVCKDDSSIDIDEEHPIR